MKNPKYHIYLTNEERSEVLKSLIDLKNEMIAQGNFVLWIGSKRLIKREMLDEYIREAFSI